MVDTDLSPIQKQLAASTQMMDRLLNAFAASSRPIPRTNFANYLKERFSTTLTSSSSGRSLGFLLYSKNLIEVLLLFQRFLLASTSLKCQTCLCAICQLTGPHSPSFSLRTPSLSSISSLSFRINNSSIQALQGSPPTSQFPRSPETNPDTTTQCANEFQLRSTLYNLVQRSGTFTNGGHFTPMFISKRFCMSKYFSENDVRQRSPAKTNYNKLSTTLTSGAERLVKRR